VGRFNTDEVVTISLSLFDVFLIVDLAFKREISEALFAMARLYADGFGILERHA
ncbi:MAG: hypothetical protein RLZZ92_724, partial [Actinomycetota bacterium]